VRPATDALRQALFSSLGGRVEGARFLDLFAGSGAYGLEALSRGAAGGVWVERDRRAVACLEKNLAAVLKSAGHAGGASRRGEAGCEFVGEGRAPFTKILTADVTSPSWEAAASALAPDFVFIDPPYEVIARLAAPLFARLRALLGAGPQREAAQAEPALAVPSAPLVIIEHPGGQALAPEGWHCVKRLGGKHPRQPSLSLFALAEAGRPPEPPIE